MNLTGDDSADALLAAEGNALLIGMVLDQRNSQPCSGGPPHDAVDDGRDQRNS